MEIETIVMICICAALLGVIIWLIVKKWNGMSQDVKNGLAEKGYELISYLKTAYTNDGKIDMTELKQIMNYLVGIVSYLAGQSASAVQVKTGTENILAEPETTSTE